MVEEGEEEVAEWHGCGVVLLIVGAAMVSMVCWDGRLLLLRICRGMGWRRVGYINYALLRVVDTHGSHGRYHDQVVLL